MGKFIVVMGDLHSGLWGDLQASVAAFGFDVSEVNQIDGVNPAAAVLVAASLGEIEGQLKELGNLASGSAKGCFVVVAAKATPDLFLNATRLGARDVIALPEAGQALVPAVLDLLRLRLQQASLQQAQEPTQQTPPSSAAHKQVTTSYQQANSDQATTATNTKPTAANLEPGISGVMESVFKAAGVAARHDLNLLITGETGTGKEFAARLVHRSSNRNQGPFIPINCTALPGELLESELFGHSSGAFTGAGRSRPGLIEAAEGGSLLLDEIGDLPLDLQPKLLQFLEGKTFSRLGETQRRTANVRIIAATHKNLPELVKEGKFRADLYFRLNQAQLRIPPVRERPEDLASLITGFIHEFNQQLGLEVQGFSEQLLHQAQNYAWPGNLRELRNLVRLAALDVRQGPLLNLPLLNSGATKAVDINNKNFDASIKADARVKA